MLLAGLVVVTIILVIGAVWLVDVERHLATALTSRWQYRRHCRLLRSGLAGAWIQCGLAASQMV